MIPHHDLDAATNEIWERILRVNVLGTWNVIRAAAPHLRASGDGVILNITSLAGVRPVGSSIPYAVSKAALNHLTVAARQRPRSRDPRPRRGARAHRHRRGPRAGTTCAPTVRTTAPLRRSGTPDDVADGCVALVAARYATGQVLVVDGGMALR